MKSIIAAMHGLQVIVIAQSPEIYGLNRLESEDIENESSYSYTGEESKMSKLKERETCRFKI